MYRPAETIRAVQFTKDNRYLLLKNLQELQQGVCSSTNPHYEPILMVPCFNGLFTCELGDYIVKEEFPEKILHNEFHFTVYKKKEFEQMWEPLKEYNSEKKLTESESISLLDAVKIFWPVWKKKRASFNMPEQIFSLFTKYQFMRGLNTEFTSISVFDNHCSFSGNFKGTYTFGKGLTLLNNPKGKSKTVSLETLNEIEEELAALFPSRNCSFCEALNHNVIPFKDSFYCEECWHKQMYSKKRIEFNELYSINHRIDTFQTKETLFKSVSDVAIQYKAALSDSVRVSFEHEGFRHIYFSKNKEDIELNLKSKTVFLHNYIQIFKKELSQ